ncbi:hypothetical protein QJS10_CPA08g01093 [Acorus calamus]|uniref:CCHC-type domain-containing protein n=1 Tax=Acorus calamus TaxID=4465 RepID=A0AAV9EE76_ACOCL|nr:hypothetical protein QJS10_CPA08g01093 [Acorus calamus]
MGEVRSGDRRGLTSARDLQNGWTKVMSKRKRQTSGDAGWNSEGRIGGFGRRGARREGTFLERRCFRCLDWGHLAAECREPPRCWQCGKVGHRRFYCRELSKPMKAATQQTIPGPSRTKLSGSPRTVGSALEVEISWTKELAMREECFSRSVILVWKGKVKADWTLVEKAIKEAWRDLPCSQVWPLGAWKAIIRLPSFSVRDVLLQARSITLPSGRVSFLPWGCDDGSVGGGGRRYDIILRGLPLLWRTGEAIRSLVGSFGHILGVSEEVIGEDEYPRIKVGVWMGPGPGPPSLVVGRLGGWKVPIEVEVVERSFAEVVGVNLVGDRSPLLRKIVKKGATGESESVVGTGSKVSKGKETAVVQSPPISKGEGSLPRGGEADIEVVSGEVTPAGPKDRVWSLLGSGEKRVAQVPEIRPEFVPGPSRSVQERTLGTQDVHLARREVFSEGRPVSAVAGLAVLQRPSDRTFGAMEAVGVSGGEVRAGQKDGFDGQVACIKVLQLEAPGQEKVDSSQNLDLSPCKVDGPGSSDGLFSCGFPGSVYLNSVSESNNLDFDPAFFSPSTFSSSGISGGWSTGTRVIFGHPGWRTRSKDSVELIGSRRDMEGGLDWGIGMRKEAGISSGLEFISPRRLDGGGPSAVNSGAGLSVCEVERVGSAAELEVHQRGTRPVEELVVPRSPELVLRPVEMFRGSPGCVKALDLGVSIESKGERGILKGLILGSTLDRDQTGVVGDQSGAVGDPPGSGC